jgi:hypothetical protein
MSIEHLAAAGILETAAVRRTAAGIAGIQRPDGSIPWFHGDKTDPWDHVEAAMALDVAGLGGAAELAYRWLADRQNADGSWYANYADTSGGAGAPTDKTKDANFTAYLAVGVLHHWLLRRDDAFLAELWPNVRDGVEFVLGLQRPDGAIRWNPDSGEALLTGSSSMYHALRCAVAIAGRRGEPRRALEWTEAALRLGRAVSTAGGFGVPDSGVFAPKDRYSMDWYYPVLGTALRGPAARARIDAGWDRFVVPGLGTRCVADRPWVTGGETFELCIALWALGRVRAARRLLSDVCHLRDEADGLYWTGYVYADRAVWPQEKTSWTAGSLLLALAALGGEPATRAVFGGDALPAGLPEHSAAAACPDVSVVLAGRAARSL